MWARKDFVVCNLRGMTFVNVISNDYATDRDIVLKRSSHTYKHLNVEGTELLVRLGCHESCITVPLLSYGMYHHPVTSGIGKAPILVERVLFSYEQFFTEQMCPDCLTLVLDRGEN